MFPGENCSYPKPLHGGNVWQACREFGGKPEEYLDFSSNINPLGPSARALEAVKAALDRLWRYPDPDCLALKGALADYLGVPVEWLLPGNGTAELINLLVAALGIKRAVIPVPTFSEYAGSVTAWGGKVYTTPLLPGEDFRISLPRLTAILPGANALFLCHPNNPTGYAVPHEELAILVEESARAGAFLVVDEAFLDFLPEREALTAIGFLHRYHHVMILYSLTKFFGLAGLRLGVLVAVPAVLAKIKAVVPPWNVNTLAQVAGAAAVADGEYIDKSRRVVAAEREFLKTALNDLPGVRVIPGTANFLLVDIHSTGLRTGAITRRLAEKRILVRDVSNFAGLGDWYIRIAVRLRSENRCLVEGLRAVSAQGS